MSSIDVLVVGAGPAGLTAAAELARHGLRVRLIDKKPSARPTGSRPSKAIGLYARTLEVFEDIGVLRSVLHSGLKLYNLNLYADNKRVVQIAMDDLDSPYAFVMSLPQFETERILREHALALGVQIDNEVELLNLRPDERWVTADLAHKDGRTENVVVPWLLACDGTDSRAQALLKADYEFEDESKTYSLVDARLGWAQPADEAHMYLAPGGSISFWPLPMEDYWRVMVADEDTHSEEDVSLSYFEQVINERMGHKISLREPLWMSRVQVQERRLNSFRHGRVFFVGDSAHNHTPLTGQGLNAGIQDAYNLAWKLSLVVRGLGSDNLLDSYHYERSEVARSLIKGSSNPTRAVTWRHPISQELREQFAGLLGSMDVIRQRLAKGLGELDQNYRGSPIVDEDRASLLEARLFTDRSVEQPSLSDWREFGAGPRAGDRAPNGQVEVDDKVSSLFEQLRGTLHTLLLFDGQAPTEEGYVHLNALARDITRRYSDRVRVIIIVPGENKPTSLQWTGPVALDTRGELHHKYGASAECLYFVRPDGYIAYRCQPASADRLHAYLESLFKGPL